MKRLMKKKVSLMGREFSVFAIAIVAMMAFGSAALVSYISNPVSGNVDVYSPLTLEISLTSGGAWTNSVDIPDIYGSDSFELFTLLTNNADALVSASAVEIVVSNDKSSDVECAEFEMRVTGTSGTTACSENGDGTVTLTTSAISLVGGASQEIPFTVTSAVNIEPASYVFTAQVPYT